jgi:tetratricopeptide (TPR) repeat protein
MPWLIELRNAAGQQLRQAWRVVGQTVRFKGLLPGIYRIYVSGENGRRSCQSVDLTPAGNRSSQEFRKELPLPEYRVRQADLNQVDLASLQIPPEALNEMGASEKAALNGREAEAAAHLRRALEVCPGYADAWNNLGAHYHRSGDYARSIESFTRVTELKPGSYLGWMNLGSSLLAAGRFAEAMEASRKAHERNPQSAAILVQLGLCCYYEHDYEDAELNFSRALELDPACDHEPHLFLAHIAMGQNRPAEALEYVRGFLRYHPNSPEAPRAKRILAMLTR